MACHIPPLKKAMKKTRGSAITYPQSHPFEKCRIQEWDGTEDG